MALYAETLHEAQCDYAFVHVSGGADHMLIFSVSMIKVCT